MLVLMLRKPSSYQEGGRCGTRVRVLRLYGQVRA
jgi:hypothetical protein